MARLSLPIFQKEKIGEDACTLIGSMLLSGIQLAVLYRAKQLETYPQGRFYVYVDEMHSFRNPLLCRYALRVPAKYGLGLFFNPSIHGNSYLMKSGRL
jgi:hypothetical protein